MDQRGEEYMKLQNGSDIRGVAMEGVAGEEVNLTAERVRCIAAAFAVYLSERYGREPSKLRIGVGHDSRLTADKLTAAALAGLESKGVTVFDCGLSSTPSMFMSTVLEYLTYDASVMITASHLPFNRNGMKFFTRRGGLEKEDIKRILEIAASMPEAETGSVTPARAQKIDLLGHYSEALCSIIRREVKAEDYLQPLNGLHIVVDASNGAGGFFAERVLASLGADITGSLCLEPDGTFPNHVPNPEDKAAMDAIRRATLTNHADLGVIFDTDVDRSAAVFPDGQEINRNAIIAMIAAIVARKHPGTTVVTDSVTSDELTEFLEGTLGLHHHRFKRGYRNVINEAIRLNGKGVETHLAIETSGHGALKENYFLDDGAYMSVKIICELARRKREGKSIASMLDGLKYPKESREYRLAIKADDFKAYGSEVLADFEKYADSHELFKKAVPNYEGVRVSFDDDEVKGWLLLRMSLHDPLMPLNIEAKEEGGADIIVSRIRPFLEKWKSLDISTLPCQ